LKSQKMSGKRLLPGVSVVICCYNSAQVIVPTIQALARQEVPRHIGYEVILVDNNCSDNTVDLAKSNWNNQDYSLRIIKEGKPGLIYARKTGVSEARYDLLLFVDDDNILNPDWVKTLYRLYKKMPRVGFIGGYNEPLVSGEKPAWFDRYQGIYACGPRDEKSGLNPRGIFGAGLSFRTEAIKSVLFSPLPPFLTGVTGNTLLRGEDAEMALRCRLLGWDSYYDESLKLQHHLLPRRLTWGYVCRAQKGDGSARVILKIYRDLLNNREPWCFSRWVRYVLGEWKRYLKKNGMNIFRINKQGSLSSFQFYWLVGMSRGLWWHRKSYDDIQQRISAYFKQG
jgi:glycosyltransferase involved in cell wall biosynthesis